MQNTNVCHESSYLGFFYIHNWTVSPMSAILYTFYVFFLLLIFKLHVGSLFINVPKAPVDSLSLSLPT